MGPGPIRVGVSRAFRAWMRSSSTTSAPHASRLNKLGSGLDLLRFYHDNAEIRHGADTRDLDIGFQDRIVCGRFVDEDRPTFSESMDTHFKQTLGERYLPMAPQGGWIGE